MGAMQLDGGEGGRRKEDIRGLDRIELSWMGTKQHIWELRIGRRLDNDGEQTIWGGEVEEAPKKV
jgi:hypothetical protein